MASFTEQDKPIQMETLDIPSMVQHFKEISVGAGSTIFKANAEGVFAGATNFTDAPWKVDYNGVQEIGDNGEIMIDGTNKKIIVGSGNEIVIDATAKTITVGSSGQVILDGSTGTITTNYLKDATYGLNGVFCYTSTNTNTSSIYTHTTPIPDTGGLLNATLNYLDSSGYYKLLPGFNVSSGTPYYYVYKDAGFYKVKYYAGNIYDDVAHTRLYITLFFNSLETNGW